MGFYTQTQNVIFPILLLRVALHIFLIHFLTIFTCQYVFHHLSQRGSEKDEAFSKMTSIQEHF